MPHESGVMPLPGGRLYSSQGVCAAERQADMGLLDIVLLVWLVVLLPLVICFFFFPDACSVAFFSFLTTSIDARWWAG